MNIIQKCSSCVCKPVCKWKEAYEKGVETVLNTSISANGGASWWRLKDCPYLEVSIRCPHMVPQNDCENHQVTE